MSDEQNVDGASEAEVNEARSLGWVDKAEWKGPENQWADAHTFLEKGRHVLPILKDRNEKLVAQLSASNSRLAQIEAESKANKAALEALTEAHEETAAATREQELADVEAAIEQASRDGDHAAVAANTKKLIELSKAPEKKEEKVTPPPPNQMAPEVQAFFLANPDFVTSPRKAALLQAMSIEIRQDANHPANRAVGKEFLDACKKEVETILGAGQPRRTSKVEDGAGGGGGGGGNGSAPGKSFADLPAEAKAVCEKQSARFVGEGKRYKDKTAWQKAYATTYFKGEQQ